MTGQFFSNLYFPICAFFCSALILVTFFSKRRVKNVETSLYKILIVTEFFESIIAILVMIVGYVYDVSYLVYLLNRIDFICYMIWIYSFFLYVFYISFTNSDKKSIFHYDLVKKITFVINFCLLILILILPLNIFAQNNVAYAYGPAVTCLYIAAVIDTLGIIISVFCNIKNIRNKKYLPLLFLILFVILALIIRSINPGLIIISAVITYINLIMYFTIENPDVKMVNELELAKSNAEKANNAKTEFLSSMSHEIRTPLNAIVGFSNAILEDKTLKEAQDEAKDIIMASNNLLEIVNGILDISKIEAGKMEIVNTNYNLVSMCNDIVKLIRPRIGEKPIELRCKFSSDIPGVLYGDMGKVKEIITNILTNAAKYTDKGLITFEVSCINEKNTCKLVISVEDTGRGIKPEKIDKLFTKFNRLEEDRNTTLEGTGLGLAITKSLVDMMNGKIIVQSKYGSGSKFTVYLSQKIISMNDDKKKEEKEEVKEKNYSSKKVLVVDDNNLNIKVCTRLLKDYHIIPDTCISHIIPDTCISGYECIEKVKNTKYDLILMDDMMPKLSGVETFHKLKEDDSFNTPVVILTANAISGMKEKYLSEGLDDYLAKPIDKLELDRVLDEYLNRQHI